MPSSAPACHARAEALRRQRQKRATGESRSGRNDRWRSWSADPHVEMRSKSEEGQQQNGRSAYGEPARVRTDISGLDAAQHSANTLCSACENAVTAADNCAVKSTPQDVAGDDQHRLHNEEAVDLIDPVFIEHQPIECAGASSHPGWKLRLAA